MDDTEAAGDFGWKIEISLPTILEGIAQHASQHPDWLKLSYALNHHHLYPASRSGYSPW